MKVSFRPAVRVNTPLIIGLAGPTKSGKTYSALRLATGLANGGPIAMINAEGPRGHQYAERFKYIACELSAPYRPDAYIDALMAAREINPAAIIIDSVSHCHDGPGGILEWHEEILDQIAGNDYDKRNKNNFTAWIKPKSAENKLIYAMLEMPCPLILAMRAKEKLKIVPGRPPQDLGWQPIVGERIAFETIFTLVLTPHCKGVPDLALSEMREPFDSMIEKGKPIDEALGRKLAAWAAGGVTSQPTPKQSTAPAADGHQAAAPVPVGAEAQASPAPNVFDESAAEADWRAKLDEVSTMDDVQKVWDDIVKDKRVTSAIKPKLYKHYQSKLKAMKGQ